MPPNRTEAVVFQPVHGSDVWGEIPSEGRFLTASTKRKNKNRPANFTGGSWIDYWIDGNNLTLGTPGQSVQVPTMSVEDGALSSLFLYPIDRFVVPVKRLESLDDLRSLKEGDTLVALQRTIENPAYADADVPLTHEHQLAFVKKRTENGSRVLLEITGVATADDPTDFNATYTWTTDLEQLAQAGTPTAPQYRFPLAPFFARVEWPALEDVEAQSGANVSVGDYLVCGAKPYRISSENTLEPGEVATVISVDHDPSAARILFHSNGGRAERSPADLAQAGVRVVRGTLLRSRLTPERFGHLPPGSTVWVAPGKVVKGAAKPDFVEGTRLLLTDHLGSVAVLAPASEPKETFTVPHASADDFEAQPDDDSPPPPAPAPSPSRVLLTLERASRLRRGEALYVASAQGVGLPVGSRVTITAANDKRNRLGWKNPDGTTSSAPMRSAVEGGWFDVDPASEQAQLPQESEPRVPLTRPAYDALQPGSVLIGAGTTTNLGITEGKEYAVKAVDASATPPRIVVPLDDGTERGFSPMEASAHFDLRAKDAPAVIEEEEEPPAAPIAQAASALPAEPKEALEELEYRRELVRDRPLKGPSFRHRERVLNAMRRLLGEPSAAGLYTPGLYALADYGPTYDLLRAGWLVRDGSTMLMGIAGTGKTTFIKYGTRIMCGAPPRLVPKAQYDAAQAEPDAKARRDLLASLRVGTLRVGGQVVPATDAAFDELIEQQKRVRREAWMIPADPDAALRMERRRRLGKRPPSPLDEPSLYREGRSEHVIAAWAIHDAVNALAMLPPGASSLQRAKAEDAASAVKEADAAWYREVFNAFFDYFASTFIGEAKSDPEKSPDEVLYKTRVLNVTYPNVATIRKAIPDSFGVPEGSATETVIFPEAQPIVGSVVKFVNETNRMSRALGDAFLGLLAEKEVEYRGQKFRSPDSIWWFDMNPHLGWGTLDWAFLDRIDVSIIIPAINLSAKLAYEDARQGRRRAQEAAFVYEAPEFTLDELAEIWRDVESVDVGAYWSDESMSDLTELGFALPSDEAKREGQPSVTYDPIHALRLSAAMLEYFVATPPGFDFSRFVSHPMKGPDPHDPQSGGGEHWEHLYERMLQENQLKRDDVATLALYAKLQRPFGFRAQASLRKYAKALAWLRGSRRVELEDVLAVLPFVLNHRLALNYEESSMSLFFSVYDWLTRRAEA